MIKLKDLLEWNMLDTGRSAGTSGPDDAKTQPFDATNQSAGDTMSPDAWWIATPGSPYRMSNQIFSMALIPNEARQAMKNWLAYVKPAWKQYGSPEKWPNEARQKAEDLGAVFAQAVGSSLPPTDNAPREPGPPSGMWA